MANCLILINCNLMCGYQEGCSLLINIKTNCWIIALRQFCVNVVLIHLVSLGFFFLDILLLALTHWQQKYLQFPMVLAYSQAMLVPVWGLVLSNTGWWQFDIYVLVSSHNRWSRHYYHHRTWALQASTDQGHTGLSYT